MSYNFLVVDDTSFMRKMATDCLNQHGYNVVGEAINGREAVKKYKELQPHVVMMDLTMPEMNGLDAIKEVLSYDAEAIILVCSASNQKDMIQDALRAGAVGYLMKPFKPDYMNEIIKRYAEPHITLPEAEDIEGTVQEAVDYKSEPIESNEGDTHMDEEDTDEAFEEVAASVETISLDAEDTASDEEPSLTEIDVPEVKVVPAEASVPVEKKQRKPISDKKINFVTSYMCNWEEDILGENKAYSFTYTENDNKITIDMTNENQDTQTIQLTLDGFRELHDWLEQRLEEGNRL
jgi:DNA-binding NarL/FixJ family response regulator